MPQFTSIDEVLSELEKIISDAEKSGDRVGYFAALYHKVTSAVKNGIQKGDFEDGLRMARLDILFANRYIQAVNQWKTGDKQLTESWKIAFDGTKKSSLLVLQHLLLGINAHINLDLGIAAVEAISGQQIDNIHIDFAAINVLIGSLTYAVINALNRISPFLSLMGLHSNRTNSILIQFSVGNARDGAWCFAEDLCKKNGEVYVNAIKDRDREISKLARALTVTSGLLRFTLWLVHLFEWKDASKITAQLFGYKKTFLKADMVR